MLTTGVLLANTIDETCCPMITSECDTIEDSYGNRNPWQHACIDHCFEMIRIERIIVRSERVSRHGRRWMREYDRYVRSFR
jgi:hypothetical protein